MEFSNDELRRDLAASRRQQASAMRRLREGLSRVLEDDGRESAAEKADLLVGGWGRRRFLAVGGLSVATAAVLAACGSGGATGVPESGIGPTTTALPDQVLSDTTLLRTASSLEHTAIAVYQVALDSGSLSAPVAELAKLFQDQHREHAAFFEKLTKDNGGVPFTEPNPVVQAKVVDPALQLIVAAGTKENDLVFFARTIEEVAAGTYQSFVPQFSQPTWRGDVMSVGGVEARHAATLTKLLPIGQVVPLAPETTTSTTATVAPEGDAPVPPTEAIAPIYQVPGPFNPQSAVPVFVGVDEISVELLGPNSYMYE